MLCGLENYKKFVRRHHLVNTSLYVSATLRGHSIFFNYIYKKFWISVNSFRKFFGIVIEAEKYSYFDFFFKI